jgi:multiple sugar transport system substrate-binding protein
MRGKNIILSMLFFGSFFLIFTQAFAKPVTVVVQDEMMTKKWFNQVADAYMKEYPDKKVNLLFLSGTENNFFTKLQLMLKNDKNIDVIYEAEDMVKADVSAGLLANLDQLKSWDGWAKFYPAIRNRCIIDNKIYGAPLSTDTRGLFYNTELFKKAGIKLPWQPKNWQDILNTCKTLKEKIPSAAPFTMSVSSNGEATSIQTLQMLLSGTDDVLFKDGKWIVTSKGLLNSFKFVEKMCKDKFTPRLGILLNQQYGNILLNQMAPKNQVAIILDGCWLPGRWLSMFPEAFKNYKMIPFPTEFGQKPGYTSMSGGWLLSVNEKSENKKAAVDFIKFALNKENLLNYSKTEMNISTRKDVPEMKSYPEWLKTPADFMHFTHFRPSDVNYAVISSKLQVAVEEVAISSKTPLDAMNSFADSVERTVGKNKVLREYKEK